MTKNIWYNPDAEYIGATGCNTIREMAELAKGDTGNGITELLFGGNGDGPVIENPSLDDFEARLNAMGVEPVTITVTRARQEIWEPEWMRPCAVGDKPGRGRIKVLGVRW
jgi:hypothetical protein